MEFHNHIEIRVNPGYLEIGGDRRLQYHLNIYFYFEQRTFACTIIFAAKIEDGWPPHLISWIYPWTV